MGRWDAMSVGDRIGRLIVREKYSCTPLTWKCECQCGAIVEVANTNLDTARPYCRFACTTCETRLTQLHMSRVLKDSESNTCVDGLESFSVTTSVTATEKEQIDQLAQLHVSYYYDRGAALAGTIRKLIKRGLLAIGTDNEF